MQHGRARLSPAATLPACRAAARREARPPRWRFMILNANSAARRKSRAGPPRPAWNVENASRPHVRRGGRTPRRDCGGLLRPRRQRRHRHRRFRDPHPYTGRLDRHDDLKGLETPPGTCAHQDLGVRPGMLQTAPEAAPCSVRVASQVGQLLRVFPFVGEVEDVVLSDYHFPWAGVPDTPRGGQDGQVEERRAGRARVPASPAPAIDSAPTSVGEVVPNVGQSVTHRGHAVCPVDGRPNGNRPSDLNIVQPLRGGVHEDAAAFQGLPPWLLTVALSGRREPETRVRSGEAARCWFSGVWRAPERAGSSVGRHRESRFRPNEARPSSRRHGPAWAAEPPERGPP